MSEGRAAETWPPPTAMSGRRALRWPPWHAAARTRYGRGIGSAGGAGLAEESANENGGYSSTSEA